MANELIYAYCVLHSSPELGEKTEFTGLESIASGGFYVVVKMVSDAEYSEENLKKNLSDIAWLDMNARSHVSIISLLMENHTVIPFNFGTIYHSVENLNKFIEDYSDLLIRNLQCVDRQEEWVIKVYSNQLILKEHIDSLSPEAAELEKQIMASSPGKAFLLTRKKADLIGNEIEKLCKNYGQEYFNEFKTLSGSDKLNNLIPKEFTCRNDNMILNASFLVVKDLAIEFLSLARRLKNKYSDLGFDLEITGPWPPFSFVAIKEK
jgi:hypothetical protein